MHLIDDVHTHLHLRRCINDIIPQVTDIIYTIIGGCIDLQHIHTGAVINTAASLTAITGIPILRILTVYSLRQDLGGAGLTRSPGTGEQISVAQATALQLGFQGLGDRHLTNYVIKGLGAVFTV